MDIATVAQKAPFAVPVEAGKTYHWCACGKSKGQPYCDGAHTGSTFKPLSFDVKKTDTVYLCGCKQTKTPPYCDGAHKAL